MICHDFSCYVMICLDMYDKMYLFCSINSHSVLSIANLFNFVLLIAIPFYL